MSDSGTENSSDGYEASPGRVSADASPEYDRKVPSSPKSVSSDASSPRAKTPCSPPASPLSPRDASPKSASEPVSPQSPGSPRSMQSPKSPRSPRSPSSRHSSIKFGSASPKSYRSGNSMDSPRSHRSSPPPSPSKDAGSYVSGPSSPKSMRDDPATPKSMASEPRSPRSLKSDRNTSSRHSSPKSPMSGRSSPKSLISEQSSSKSFKFGGPDDNEDDKNSLKIKSDTKNNSFNDLDGEQISDGDIEDEPEQDMKSKPTPITHGEDLSDVSDLDSLDGVEETDQQREESNEREVNSHVREEEQKIDNEEKVSVNIAEESEQLDFEAEGQWKDDREDAESEVPAKEFKDVKEKDPKDEEKDKDKDKAKVRESGEILEDNNGEMKEDGEKAESELEEGELSDGDDARPEETEPRPVCRFYNRGQCTWGVSCRFLHPGVTDKGNYTMFDMVRPMAYPPHGAPHDYRPHIERPAMPRPMNAFPGHSHPKGEDLPPESAWERGLRHAKEMMRKANKRKESDMDFEEKKMNLSLGQEELDREAGYYVRPMSPEPPVERWVREPPPRRVPHPRITPDHYEEPEGYPPYPPSGPPEYYRRVQYKVDPRAPPEYRERIERHPIPRATPHPDSPPPIREHERERERDREREYYEKYEKKHKKPSREVIVERIPPTKPWREEEPPPVERGRGDEWADPWMRRKSPTAVRRSATSNRRPRRQSYSSGSSYSSTSSSRSSSRSSYSSYDSLSRSRSLSPSIRARTHAKGKHPPSPPPVNSSSQSRGAMLMNPPAPSPRGTKGSISPTGTLHRRAGLNPPAPSPLATQRHHEKSRDKAALAAAAVAKIIKSGRSRSRSSHSSSGSESSGSSSDSSESSYSSASSVDLRRKKGPSPPHSRKELASSKNAEVSLKSNNSKQQIKLSLKTPNNVTPTKKIDRSATIAGKKRPIESPPVDNKASVAAAAAKAAKKASSRREELLKQLKAVEDAIARKRSKV